jgi:two-component system CheB/CheR fusion protein
VTNLLGNAAKFTARGGRVYVSVRRDGRRCTLRVRDTGIGIDPGLLPSLFEPFSQGAQPIDRSAGGLGLGLSMVKGLVELHRGKVEIESGVGVGTTVTVTLPVLGRAGWTTPMAEVRSGGPRRVLVIDDNADNADSIAEALSLLGHDTRVAYGGYQGLELIHDFEPDVVLCDIGLPGIDGYAVAKAVRAEAKLRTCFLVALSGYTQLNDIERAKQAGFDRHLAKPTSIQQLTNVLAEAPVQHRRDDARLS